MRHGGFAAPPLDAQQRASKKRESWWLSLFGSKSCSVPMQKVRVRLSVGQRVTLKEEGGASCCQPQSGAAHRQAAKRCSKNVNVFHGSCVKLARRERPQPSLQGTPLHACICRASQQRREKTAALFMGFQHTRRCLLGTGMFFRNRDQRALPATSTESLGTSPDCKVQGSCQPCCGTSSATSWPIVPASKETFHV